MSAFDQLSKKMNLISDLGAATSVLGWDQETYMPDGAVAGRAEQMATLSSFIHSHTVGAESIELVRNVKQELDSLSVRQRLVAETFIRDHERSLKLPADLVNDQARTASMAQDAWKRSRQASDFSIFQPLLERTVELKRREAEIIGPAQHIYDNLLDSFEPGLTVATITPVFDRLRTGTIALLSELEPKQTSVHDDVLYRMYNGDQQVTFASSIIKKLGFNFQTGRVDISAHPFCTSFGSTDVRLTTRIRPNDLRSCLFGLIHEAGHGMYEQGISPELARTFSGQGASMGIHESQSLFWENIIARSEEFWHWAFPQLRDAFPDQLKDQDARSFYCAINKIKPSLNRVESDELTYNLHIILRFEIERDLIEGVLEVRDIPKVWNEKMEAALGVVPANDSEGCLQDVHWSFGGIGYFPSYTLGKLYAAMEWNAMQVAIPDVKTRISSGDFAPILSWLRSHIHEYGRTEVPSQIIQRISGRPLTEVDFLNYVGAKARNVYGI